MFYSKHQTPFQRLNLSLTERFNPLRTLVTLTILGACVMILSAPKNLSSSRRRMGAVKKSEYPNSYPSRAMTYTHKWLVERTLKLMNSCPATKERWVLTLQLRCCNVCGLPEKDLRKYNCRDCDGEIIPDFELTLPRIRQALLAYGNPNDNSRPYAERMKDLYDFREQLARYIGYDPENRRETPSMAGNFSFNEQCKTVIHDFLYLSLRHEHSGSDWPPLVCTECGVDKQMSPGHLQRRYCGVCLLGDRGLRVDLKLKLKSEPSPKKQDPLGVLVPEKVSPPAQEDTEEVNLETAVKEAAIALLANSDKTLCLKCQSNSSWNTTVAWGHSIGEYYVHQSKCWEAFIKSKFKVMRKTKQNIRIIRFDNANRGDSSLTSEVKFLNKIFLSL